MTAVLPARVPAGAPGGGQFAPKACRAAYAALDELAHRAADPAPGSNRVVLEVARCPHGSFARWAARNCCADVLPAAGGGARCTGSRRDGARCTRPTLLLDPAGRPACHHHGGRSTAAA